MSTTGNLQSTDINDKMNLQTVMLKLCFFRKFFLEMKLKCFTYIKKKIVNKPLLT